MARKSSSWISKFSPQFRRIGRIMVSAPMTIGIVSVAVTGLLLGVRQVGKLQSLELAAFDRMVRFRPDPDPDPRLLVVAITEADIQAQKNYPLTDKVLAQLLEELERHQPRIIGLDLVRNVPTGPGHAELQRRFQNPRLIAVTHIGNTETESVPPPPGIPEERIGFSDLVTDPDGTIRRNLMYASTQRGTLVSFSLRVVLTYLAEENIFPQQAGDNQVQLSKTVFQQLRPDAGGYQTLDAQGYQILLNYHSADNVARQVTLTQVLQRQIDPSWVKDKIVLIGTTAPTAGDMFYTPYSTREIGNPRMAGVLIHAQMVSQFLDAVLEGCPLFRYWSEWMEVLWIAGWSAVGGILAWRFQNPLLLGVSVATGLGVLFTSGFILFTQAVWIPLAAPALALIVTSTAWVTYQLQQAKQQEQMVMKLLGQQTSPEIAKALWHERDHLLEDGLLPGQTLIATILITDLVGFSTISEKMPPSAVMAWLNEYLEVVAQEVQNYQGIINKFTGDGILAVFGVPVPRTTSAEIAEDAYQAVACALAISERLPELNREWIERGLPVVRMRVGIYTGPVMVGSLGGKNRLEYGVIGDSVNIAARLESYRKDRQPVSCRILIARETLVHLQDQFEVECWGAITLKGKQQTVEVYRILGRLLNSHLSSISHTYPISGELNSYVSDATSHS